MNRLTAQFVCFCLAGLASQSPAALLSYWNFNNDSPAYSSSVLGSFSLSAAAYGETYSSNTLTSNTANGTVFNGSGIYIDFSNLSTQTANPTVVNNPVINGKVWLSSSQAQTNTAYGGFGTFSDTTGNRVSGDTTTGGSMIIMNPSGSELGHYITLKLSSSGYDTLALSYDTRTSSGFAGSEVWSYSLDGTTFSNLTSLSLNTNGSFAGQSLNLSSLSSNALNNLGTFYLRMTLNSANNGGSYAFDNLQLNGTAVPEPSQIAPIGLGLLCLMLRRRGGRAEKTSPQLG